MKYPDLLRRGWSSVLTDRRSMPPPRVAYICAERNFLRGHMSCTTFADFLRPYTYHLALPARLPLLPENTHYPIFSATRSPPLSFAYHGLPGQCLEGDHLAVPMPGVRCWCLSSSFGDRRAGYMCTRIPFRNWTYTSLPSFFTSLSLVLFRFAPSLSAYSFLSFML
jgi:hypothetical protein